MPGKKVKPTQVLELQKKLAHILTEYRIVADLSQDELSQLTGISVSGIKKIESGETAPTISSIQLYVEACGKTVGELFEPWIPQDRIEYDRGIHRRIKEMLKRRRDREFLLQMLETYRISRLPS